MPNCKCCGACAAQRPDWGRYERNGRLKPLCPECDAAYSAGRLEAQRRKQTALAAGYKRGWTSTPEYRRLQRERNAARQGRKLNPYTPQAERNYVGRMVAADAHADRVRAQWMRAWLAPFRKSDQELYRSDEEYRERQKAKFREHYRKHSRTEVERVGAYKRAHAERNLEWTAVRKERETMLADGSVSPPVIARLKMAATHCAYCGCVLTDKQTDHMISLALGGKHSLRNIVIVCPSCNGRKACLNYAEWIDRVAPEHRARVVALYLERFGALAA